VNGNKYETAVVEVRSVLGEWLDLVSLGQRIDSPFGRDVLANKIVERLIAKGVIQSTDPDDLVTPVSVRRSALPPGRTVVGGDALVPEHPPAPGSVQRNEDGG
jgi:hypothetical protein